MSVSAATTSIVRAALGTVELCVRAVQVADDPLAVVPLGELAQVGLERGVERRQPRGLALASDPLHEFEVPSELIEHLGTAHRAVPGHDRGRRRTRASRSTESSDPDDRSHHDERRAAVEHEVAGEQHRAIRDPRDDVVRRVRGPDVLQRDLEVVDPHREVIVERDERRPHLDLAPLDPRPQALRDRTRREHLVPAQLVTDNRGGGQQPVAVGVVAVMVSVHEDPHRGARHSGQRVEERAGAPLGRAGVDRGHSVAADEEPGVVQAPRAVELHVGEDAVAHLLQRRGRERLGVVDVVGRHGRTVGSPTWIPCSSRPHAKACGSSR